MALNSSGPISIAGTTAGQSIQIELGGNGTTTMSLNDAAVRALAGVPSGAIIMPTNFYGKANTVPVTFIVLAGGAAGGAGAATTGAAAGAAVVGSICVILGATESAMALVAASI